MRRRSAASQNPRKRKRETPPEGTTFPVGSSEKRPLQSASQRTSAHTFGIIHPQSHSQLSRDHLPLRTIIASAPPLGRVSGSHRLDFLSDPHFWILTASERLGLAQHLAGYLAVRSKAPTTSPLPKLSDRATRRIHKTTVTSYTPHSHHAEVHTKLKGDSSRRCCR